MAAANLPCISSTRITCPDPSKRMAVGGSGFCITIVTWTLAVSGIGASVTKHMPVRDAFSVSASTSAWTPSSSYRTMASCFRGKRRLWRRSVSVTGRLRFRKSIAEGQNYKIFPPARVPGEVPVTAPARGRDAIQTRPDPAHQSGMIFSAGIGRCDPKAENWETEVSLGESPGEETRTMPKNGHSIHHYQLLHSVR